MAYKTKKLRYKGYKVKIFGDKEDGFTGVFKSSNGINLLSDGKTQTSALKNTKKEINKDIKFEKNYWK